MCTEWNHNGPLLLFAELCDCSRKQKAGQCEKSRETPRKTVRGCGRTYTTMWPHTCMITWQRQHPLRVVEARDLVHVQCASQLGVLRTS
jgi:hypothetical protein